MAFRRPGTPRGRWGLDLSFQGVVSVAVRGFWSLGSIFAASSAGVALLAAVDLLPRHYSLNVNLLTAAAGAGAIFLTWTALSSIWTPRRVSLIHRVLTLESNPLWGEPHILSVHLDREGVQVAVDSVGCLGGYLALGGSSMSMQGKVWVLTRRQMVGLRPALRRRDSTRRV